MSTVQIEIDGKPLEVEQGSMVIEAADNAGIKIPRFCYHKKLSVAANCRMCLVEVENSRKPMPACATPVTDGMKVLTRSPLAVMSQKAVMEFLLINHPLDCPICDQGGQCELQDISMGYGRDVSRFSEGKRSIRDKDIGPLIATELTRCIQCTRCVRFGSEIAGMRELGLTGRGEHVEISTFVEGTVDSELSGNVIDVCPVGALTAKPSRFKARAWEVNQMASIAPHDCFGSNIALHVRGNEVMSVSPRENEQINEVWLSDRDRFAYCGLSNKERISKPQVKRNGVWEEVDWQEALAIVAAKLQDISQQFGAEQIGALASSSSTVEELYLLQKLIRGLGSNHIDHRLRELDFADQAQMPLQPTFDGSFDEIGQMQAIFLVGSDIRKEVPMAGHKVRQASLKQAYIASLSPLAFDYHFAADSHVLAMQNWCNQLALTLKAALAQSGAKLQLSADLQAALERASGDQEHANRVAEHLCQQEKALIILGRYALTSPEASLIRGLAFALAQCCGAKILCLTEGANAAGAWLAGAVPHRLPGGEAIAEQQQGLNARQMLENKLKAYVLLNVEPSFDSADSNLALSAVKNAEFVVSLLPFKNHIMNEYVDVILPIETFVGTSGTLINAAGQWQSFSGAVQPLSEARPAWKVLRVLANALQLDGFEQTSSEEVLAELKQHLPQTQMQQAYQLSEVTAKPYDYGQGLLFVPKLSLYSTDALVRRASALQETKDAAPASIFVNQTTLEKYGLSVGGSVKIKHGGSSASYKVVVDNAVQGETVVVPVGTAAAISLAAPYQVVETVCD